MSEQFFAITETNDWEGETWTVFIDAEANADTIGPLQAILDKPRMFKYMKTAETLSTFQSVHVKIYGDEPKRFTASEVKTLVENAYDGYMPSHFISPGVLDVAALEAKTDDELTEVFYKMQICDYFVHKPSDMETE